MMSPDLQDRIARALNYGVRVPVLTAHLKQLKVVINYLSAMAHIDRDKPLKEYIIATFGKDPEYLPADAQLRHVKHVWLLVKYVQTDLLKRQHQVCSNSGQLFLF